jgi:glycosyltransferase involved in cell wall biosynthesis
MRIGVVAPPWLPVPPRGYGGTEQVVDDLCRGLSAAGHEVVLATVGTSTCPVVRRSRRAEPDPHMGAALPESAHVLWAYEQLAADGAEVVHDHTIVGPLLAAARHDLPPVVTTHHGPFDADAIRVFERVGSRVAVVAISHSQRCAAPTVPVRSVIHHGVDTAALQQGPGGDALLFLGRMSEQKGVHRAIRAARIAGRPLVVVTKMWEAEERAYYDEVVRPMLGDDVTLLEGVDQDGRRELLQTSAALLNPIRWREPFGLVMAEALACGTPVIAFPEGAAPEIVDDGVTGFLVDDEEQMAAAVARLPQLSRAACRSAAEQRFSVQRMTRDYVELFCQLVSAAPAATLVRQAAVRGPVDVRRISAAGG